MTTTAATSASSAAATASSATAANALASISSNYSEFLQLLTTQLQNQDPSSPMDTSQFTSELAQFASVEQQVSTNTNLTSLIQLAQGQQVLQGSALVGEVVDVTGGTLPLQQGSAQVTFTSPSAQDVTLTVTDAAGNTVAQQTTPASSGSNVWSWNGRNGSGGTEPDGAYAVTVTGGTSAAPTQLSFTTRGTVTGVTPSGSTIDLQLGATTIGIGSVSKVEGQSSTT